MNTQQNEVNRVYSIPFHVNGKLAVIHITKKDQLDSDLTTLSLSEKDRENKGTMVYFGEECYVFISFFNIFNEIKMAPGDFFTPDEKVALVNQHLRKFFEIEEGKLTDVFYNVSFKKIPKIKVLVVVSGGNAYCYAEDGAEVSIFDCDNYEAVGTEEQKKMILASEWKLLMERAGLGGEYN